MHGQVAMASGNVPDFDGVVAAAASDKLAVRRKGNGVDPVIETSEHMKHTGTQKDNQKKNLPVRVPGHRALTKVHDEIIHDEIMYILMFSSIYFSKKVTFSSGRSHRHSDRNMIVLLIFWHID